MQVGSWITCSASNLSMAAEYVKTIADGGLGVAIELVDVSLGSEDVERQGRMRSITISGSGHGRRMVPEKGNHGGGNRRVACGLVGRISHSNLGSM